MLYAAQVAQYQLPPVRTAPANLSLQEATNENDRRISCDLADVITWVAGNQQSDSVKLLIDETRISASPMGTIGAVLRGRRFRFWRHSVERFDQRTRSQPRPALDPLR